jgi:hypothetical protein
VEDASKRVKATFPLPCRRLAHNAISEFIEAQAATNQQAAIQKTQALLRTPRFIRHTSIGQRRNTRGRPALCMNLIIVKKVKFKFRSNRERLRKPSARNVSPFAKARL